MKLEQKGRWFYIDPIPDDDLVRELNRRMTYMKKNSHFMPNPMWGKVCLYYERTNRFPVGLLFLVKDLFKDYEIITKRIPLYYNFTDTTVLRPYQKEALQSLIENYGGILKIPTGGGKTLIALKFCELTKLKTLVVVPTVYLKKQWEDLIVKEDIIVSTYQ